MRRILWLFGPLLLLAGCVSPNAYVTGTWFLDPRSVPGQMPWEPSLLAMTLGYDGYVRLDGVPPVAPVAGNYTISGDEVTINVPTAGVPNLLPASSLNGNSTIHATLYGDGNTLSVIIHGNSFLFKRQEESFNPAGVKGA